MTTAVADNPETGWTPWAERWLGETSVPPVWIGLTIGLLAWAVLLLVWWFSGEVERHEVSPALLLYQRDARIGTVMCFYAGFLPAAQLVLLRLTRANLRSLEPANPEPSLELPRPDFWRVTLPGLLAMPVIALAVDRDVSLYFTREYLMAATHWFTWPVGIFVTLNTALLAHLSYRCAQALAARAGALGRIDLLDLAPLAPFASQTLQTTLLWFVMLSIFSVNAADEAFLPAVAGVAVFAVAQIGFAALAIHRPLHRRLLDQKRAETEHINRALRGDPGAASALSLGRGAELSVADLLAYRTFIDGVRVSAFDTTAWLRAALYVAIPLGSWLGGALVERALDASLR
jgi:hypothetical protein